MIKLSTGLRNHMLDTGSVKSALDNGKFYIYGGTVPASPDDDTTGATLLCTVSLNGGASGVSFAAAASNGVIVKEPTETWEGDNVASGDATFFRFAEAGADPAAASTTEKRIQGSVGVVGADLNLSAIALVNGETQPIDFLSVTVPIGA